MKSTIKGLLAVLASAFILAACQSESSDSAGFSFPENCATCHGDSPEYPLLGAKAGYEESGHNLGYKREAPHAYYSNGGGCQKCHTHEGFVDFVKNGEPDREAYIEYPSQPGCFTCHNPHETGDFELRKSDPVTLANGVTFDKGKANLCANCHQSRKDVSDVVKASAADEINSRFGPHHGPQSDIFWGTNAYEYEGKSYSSSEHKFEVEDGCVSCHMYLPEGRFSSNVDIGGHSFAMQGTVHGADHLNIKACLSCHEDLKEVKTEFGPMFDYKASADYDQDGEVEIAQMEVVGLLELLVNTDGSGLLQQGENPVYLADGSYNTIREEGVAERTIEEVAALYNYKMFGEEDRSFGMHNYTYAVQVLMDTVSGLDPSFDTSNRPE